MSDLLNRLVSTAPGNGDAGVPLLTQIVVVLSGLDYDIQSLKDGFFLEGPDTDQFIGSGQIALQNRRISQGDMDSFFTQAGRAGIVKGSVEVTQGTDTTLSLTADLPFAPLIEYTASLTGVLAADAVTPVDGFITFSFTTGSGSIEEVPSEMSASVLSCSSLVPASPTDDLMLVSSSIPNGAVELSPDTSEIVLVFNKPLDGATITDGAIDVFSESAFSHPNLHVSVAGVMVKTLSVNGNELTISF